MRRYVQIATASSWTPGQPEPADEPLPDRFLRLACLTSGGDDAADRAAAAQLLVEHPDLPERDLAVAAACADVARVRRHIAARPSAVSQTGGPHGWSPLPYQAYARHDPAPVLETAALLIDAGADPNDGQAIYNRMSGTSDDHLVLLFEYGLRRDTQGPAGRSVRTEGQPSPWRPR